MVIITFELKLGRFTTFFVTTINNPRHGFWNFDAQWIGELRLETSTTANEVKVFSKCCSLATGELYSMSEDKETVHHLGIKAT